MVNTVRINADHGRDFNPLADHMTKLKISPRVKIYFSTFRFLLHLMLEQAVSNLIVCLMILQKTTYKSCINELACCSGY